MMIIIEFLIKSIYVKVPNEAKYQYLIKKQKTLVLTALMILRLSLIKYSNNMQDLFKNIEEYDLDY